MTARAITIMLAVAGLSAFAYGQSSSLYRNEMREAVAREVVAPSTALPAGNGLGSGSVVPGPGPEVPPVAVSLIATPAPRPQTFSKHDLITIIVREMASQSTKGNTQTSRDSKLDAHVDAWSSLGVHGQILYPTPMSRGNPAFKGEVKREFAGTGTAERTDSLVARIQAEIIDIKPNGNLVIQASKMVQTDEESYTITVTGICRTKDILPDNTILSTQVAELKIVKVANAGAVKDATKRGFVHWFLDWINLF